MKLFVFAVLLGTLFCAYFVHGFTYGVDKPVTECREFPSSKPLPVELIPGEYTRWPFYCPYDNRVTVDCDAGINPDGTIELWDVDDVSDDVSGDDKVASFKWTHIFEKGYAAYIDAHVDEKTLQDADTSVEDYVELYWLFKNVCQGDNGKDRRIPYIQNEYYYFES
uniref:Uncharacterized protein n=1 Tax=Panagrolaimus sp. JU765 TaxID=591449 RepID=A0AC34R4M6_9BILA